MKDSKMNASTKQIESNRPWAPASAPPKRPGWYERQHRVLIGNRIHPHPCPYDYFTGFVWTAGMPDKDAGEHLPEVGAFVVAEEACRDQALPWRNLPGVVQTFHKRVRTNRG